MPAYFHDYAFKRKHISVRLIKRQQLDVSAWISVDLPSAGERRGQAVSAEASASLPQWADVVSATLCLGTVQEIGPAHQRPVWMDLCPQLENFFFSLEA